MLTNFVVVLVFLALLCTSVQSADPLSRYKISGITVSGISSGGFMAGQVHIAFSSVVNGTAIFAAVCFIPNHSLDSLVAIDFLLL